MSTRTDSIPAIRVPRDLSEQTLTGFEHAIDIMIERHPDGLDLDCSDLQLVSSNHVNVLWSVREKCEQANIALRLCHVSSGLVRILRVLDLYDFFRMSDDSKTVEPESEETAVPAKDVRRYDVKLSPMSDEILDCLHSFRQFLKSLKVVPMRALELETVFYETLTNIRAHGHLNADDKIEVKVEADDKAIELTFIDGGCEFNPAENIPELDPGEAIRNRQKHGFGLTMIARMTDSMDYRRVDGTHNVLKLKKYWKR